MFELLFEGRVQGRGSREAMVTMRQEPVAFTGRDPRAYRIVREGE